MYSVNEEGEKPQYVPTSRQPCRHTILLHRTYENMSIIPGGDFRRRTERLTSVSKNLFKILK